MNDEQLNILLARVAGVDHDGFYPLTDHNQMALVKKGLREHGYGYTCYWERTALHHEAIIFKGADHEYFHAVDNDELMAFAEAIRKMKEGEDE